MQTVLLLLSIASSLLLILAVLIQPGKADMISGMGGIGGQVTNMFGVSSGRNILQYVTMGLIASLVVFALLSNTIFQESGSESGTKNALRGASKPIPANTAPIPSGR